jgi:hypothetical protein
MYLIHGSISISLHVSNTKGKAIIFGHMLTVMPADTYPVAMGDGSCNKPFFTVREIFVFQPLTHTCILNHYNSTSGWFLERVTKRKLQRPYPQDPTARAGRSSPVTEETLFALILKS